MLTQLSSLSAIIVVTFLTIGCQPYINANSDEDVAAQAALIAAIPTCETEIELLAGTGTPAIDGSRSDFSSANLIYSDSSGDTIRSDATADEDYTGIYALWHDQSIHFFLETNGDTSSADFFATHTILDSYQNVIVSFRGDASNAYSSLCHGVPLTLGRGSDGFQVELSATCLSAVPTFKTLMLNRVHGATIENRFVGTSRGAVSPTPYDLIEQLESECLVW